jgi:hydroxymethylpyrimidine/phosphomethylpyrimidine kinase
MVYDQITLSIRQSRPLALKTGMLAAEDIIYTIAEAVMEYNLQNLIIDPVLKSSSGSLLNAGSFSGKSGDNFSRCLLEELISQCLVVTPNRAEAETLSGVKIESYHDVELASKKLIEMGAKYVIIKGGHLDFDPDFSIDTVYFRNGMEKISSPRLISGNFHGTGCTFSAALCAFIAQGFDVITAARNAKRYVFCAMEQANPENPGILNHQCDFVPEI